MPVGKTVQITLAGEQRQLCYRFSALKELGLSGPLDGEGWDRAITEAGNSFDGLAKFILAGLRHEKRNDTPESVSAALDDFDPAGFIELASEASKATFGEDLIQRGKEAMNGARPTVAQTGSSAGQQPITITESEPANSGS